MITEIDSGEVTKVGVDMQADFGIAATAHAFEILSNSLYSNKPLALIRELVCNAYDAHVDKGNTTVPFDVHFPSALEPYFSVRDYGFGISPEFMIPPPGEPGYVTAFHSTKNRSNKEIGGFGLGRLSAFAYTDSYSVISRYQGVERAYLIFKESGLPTISCVSERPSTEPDGFQVTVCVESKDIANFCHWGREFFKYLREPINLIGIEAADSKPLVEGADWARWGNFNASYGSYVRMGLVHYPIDSRIIDSPLTSVGIVINLPIGSVDIAPSRESLSYSDKTKAAINAKLAEIKKALADDCQSLVDTKPTLLDATIFFAEFKKNSPDLYKLISGSIQYNGKELFPYIALTSDSHSMKSIYNAWRRGRYAINENTMIHTRWDYSVGQNKTEGTYNPLSNDLLIYDDLPDNASRRLAKLIQNNPSAKVYLLPNTPNVWQDLFGRSDFQKLSELDFDPIVRTPRAKNPLAGLKTLIYSDRYHKFIDGTPDSSKPIYYIDCKKNHLKSKIFTIQTLLDDLIRFGHSNPDFQLVWSSKSIKNPYPNAIEFEDWANKSLKMAAAIAADTYEIPSSDSLYPLESIAAAFDDAGIDSPKIKKIIELKEEARKKAPPPNYDQLVEKYGYKLKVNDSAQVEAQKLMQEKPLLEYICGALQPNALPDLLKYTES